MHELVSLLLPESRIKLVFRCILALTKCHSHGGCFTSSGNSETFLTTLISWWLPSFYKEGAGQEENSPQGGRMRIPWPRVLDSGPRKLSKITPHSPLHQTQNSPSNLVYTYLRVFLKVSDKKILSSLITTWIIMSLKSMKPKLFFNVLLRANSVFKVKENPWWILTGWGSSHIGWSSEEFRIVEGRPEGREEVSHVVDLRNSS